MGVKVPGLGLKGPKGDTGVTGPQGPKGDTGATGPAGSSASATPLATTAARALGTAAVGTSMNAAREDHVHPLPAGLQQYIGDVIINRTLLLALGSGMQREYVALAGVVPTDNLTYTCIGACSAGCAPMNVYPDTNRVLLEYNTPALGIGAVINPRVRVYRII